MANFRVGVEQAQSSICCRGTGAGHSVSWAYELSAIVAKTKLPILIVCACGASLHINFIIVVFTLVFKQPTELEGVIAADPGETVGHVKDGSRRV